MLQFTRLPISNSGSNCIFLIYYLSGLDVAKMLANRIQKLSEEKFAELSVQLQGIPNADSLKKV